LAQKTQDDTRSGSIPQTESSTFDLEYRLNKHIPMVLARLSSLGLRRIEVNRGLGGIAPGQPAPLRSPIGYMTYDALEELQAGLAVHGAEVMGGIPNFTNGQPVIQVSRIER
jgi:uncharacterized protein (TIGR02118 family)